MNTTTVFAELLIIGIQGGVWLTLLLLSIFGTGHFSTIGSSLKDWTVLVTILCLAIFYSLGIILDRIYDVAEKAIYPTRPVLNFSWVNNRAKSVLNDNRIKVHSLAGTLNNYQEYTLSRLRVARATFFNLIFISIGALLLTLIRFNWLASSLKWKIVFSICMLGVLLISLSYIAYAVLQKTSEIRNEQVLAMLLDKKDDKGNAQTLQTN